MNFFFNLKKSKILFYNHIFFTDTYSYLYFLKEKDKEDLSQVKKYLKLKR